MSNRDNIPPSFQDTIEGAWGTTASHDTTEGRTHVAAGMQRFYGMPFEPFEKYTPVGTADDIVAFLEPFVEAGAKTLSLKACGPDPETELEVIAEVAARLRR